MSQEFQIYAANCAYETRSFEFPGGELQVQIPDLPPSLSGEITVVARVQSSDAIVRLILTAEIIERCQRSGRKRLVVPYLPFARQDRVMQVTEAFSLKAFVRIINSLGFDEVVVCDPHSDVTAALVERVQVINQIDLIRAHEGVGRIIHSGVTIVAPDAGAAKKAFGVAQAYGLPLVTASKIRDVKTGTITSTKIGDASHVAGRNALIVDDICDGGRTFIELAKVLKASGAEKVYLFVTHGIFSQGLGVFAGLLDEVFTTDSFLSRDVESPHHSPIPLHVSNLTFNARGIIA